jgi:hypothetical protein
MSAPASSFFRTSLYPTFVEVQGHRVPRVILHTSWQVRRPDGAGVVGIPRQFNSLLAVEELFFSVLPFTFRDRHRIDARPISGSAPAWRGIPCTFGVAELWLPSADSPTMLRLSLQVLLPERVADPEPLYPLLGAEFLRRYEPRLVLDFAAFQYDPEAAASSLASPVGVLEWR